MKLTPLILAVSVVACVTAPAHQAALQQTANLMISIGQHGEGLRTEDIAMLSAELDEQIDVAPNDPYVLKLAAQSRLTLADYSQDRAQRVALRQQALAELDRAIAHFNPTDVSRTVMVNGMETDMDLRDLAHLRASLFHQVTTDR